MLLQMSFKLKLHKVSSKACPKARYDYSKGEEFRLVLQNRLNRLDSQDIGLMNLQSIEREWEKLKAAVTETAAKTWSKKSRRAQKEWIKPETFVLIEEKRNCSRASDRYRGLKR